MAKRDEGAICMGHKSQVHRLRSWVFDWAFGTAIGFADEVEKVIEMVAAHRNLDGVTLNSGKPTGFWQGEGCRNHMLLSQT